MRQKKNFGLGSLEADGGRWGGRTPSGTIRGRRLGQKEPFEPKKKFGLDRPSSASGGRPRPKFEEANAFLCLTLPKLSFGTPLVGLPIAVCETHPEVSFFSGI